jgi:uncharacterized SAM-dependent methyltransferase
MYSISDIVKIQQGSLMLVRKSQLIELGHVNSSKTRILFPALLKLIL